MLINTCLRFIKLPRTYKTQFWGLTSSHYWVINDWKVEAGRILPQVVMTIIFSRFKLSPSTWVAIASCQRTFGHHNLSLNTFKGPLDTLRPGPSINHEPHLGTWVKTTISIFFYSFPRECMTDYTESQLDLGVTPMTQVPSLEPRASRCR